jgi:hypothetical protein
VVVAADYPFLDILGTMVAFFGFVLWFWLLIKVFGDLFRRHELSGWAKFAWSVFVIFLPLLGVLVYLISQGKGIAERDLEQAKLQKAALDDYIRQAVREQPASGATGEVTTPK